MTSMRIALLSLLAAAFAPGMRAEPVKLPAGMLVELELQHHVTPGYMNVNAPVYFRVTNDVSVGGQTLIRKGALVTGEVEQSAGPGMVGRSGVMSLDVRIAPAVDGTLVPIDADLTQQGRSRGGALVGWTLFWGIPGLITKGVNPYIKRGAIIEATVTGETYIDPASEANVEERPAEPLKMTVKGHKFTVSSAKVFEFDIERDKDLKTIVFRIEPPPGLDNPAASLASVELVTVDEAPVPAPVHALSTTADSATFDGWSIVKFCRDGVTELGFRGVAADGHAFDGSYRLTLKIKEKRKKS